MRLDKYLSEMTPYSRKDIKKKVKARQVRVNDTLCLKPENPVTEKDKVELQNQDGTWSPIAYEKYVYYMLNKPQGVVSATTDKHDTTVVELVGVTREIFPVGRLDKDTEGLLLLTDDGELAHELLSPKKHVDKKYYVEARENLSKENVNQFLQGLDIGEKNVTKPAKLEILEDEKTCYVTICEGKFHQIKRMFHKINNEVMFLKRISMGKVELDGNLQPGQWRELTEDEVNQLKRS